MTATTIGTSTDVTETKDAVSIELDNLRLERQWVYETIFPRTVAGIKEGLQECLNLLHHADITLPLSSRETERLKGVTTRQGADIIKGDLMIKTKHGTHRLLLSKDKVIHLDQILDCTHLIEFSVNALEHELYPDTAKRVIDDVLYNLKSAHSSLLQCTFAQTFPTKVVDPHLFEPALPEHISIDLFIAEAGLVAEVRILQNYEEPSLSQLTSKFFSLQHESMSGEFVHFQGRQVKVVELIRVESQDPALIAVMAKLSALGHVVEQLNLKILATSG